MVEVRLATEKDRKAWNRVAKKAGNSTYAHTWEWKEAIEKGFGVESLCLVAEDNTGKILGIYPGFLQPLKIKNIEFISKKFKLLESPFKTTWDYGGPCILPYINKKIMEELVITMERLAKEKGAFSLWVSPFNGDELKKIMLRRNYRISERLTSVIDLTKSEDELWKELSRSTRKCIKNAEKKGVNVMLKNDLSGMKKLYKCLSDISKSKNFFIPSFTFFEEILNKMVPGNASIFIVEWDNKIIGGSLDLFHNGHVVMRYGGGMKRYQKMYPHYILYWSQIREYLKYKKYKYLDLGGLPSDKTNGIYVFKSKFKGHIKHVDWFVKYVRFGNIVNMYRKLKG